MKVQREKSAGKKAVPKADAHHDNRKKGVVFHKATVQNVG